MFCVSALVKWYLVLWLFLNLTFVYTTLFEIMLREGVSSTLELWQRKSATTVFEFLTEHVNWLGKNSLLFFLLYFIK